MIIGLAALVNSRYEQDAFGAGRALRARRSSAERTASLTSGPAETAGLLRPSEARASCGERSEPSCER